MPNEFRVAAATNVTKKTLKHSVYHLSLLHCHHALILPNIMDVLDVLANVYAETSERSDKVMRTFSKWHRNLN